MKKYYIADVSIYEKEFNNKPSIRFDTITSGICIYKDKLSELIKILEQIKYENIKIIKKECTNCGNILTFNDGIIKWDSESWLFCPKFSGKLKRISGYK
jgi:hypothetical protein